MALTSQAESLARQCMSHDEPIQFDLPRADKTNKHSRCGDYRNRPRQEQGKSKLRKHYKIVALILFDSFLPTWK